MITQTVAVMNSGHNTPPHLDKDKIPFPYTAEKYENISRNSSFTHTNRTGV